MQLWSLSCHLVAIPWRHFWNLLTIRWEARIRMCWYRIFIWSAIFVEADQSKQVSGRKLFLDRWWWSRKEWRREGGGGIYIHSKRDILGWIFDFARILIFSFKKKRQNEKGAIFTFLFLTCVARYIFGNVHFINFAFCVLSCRALVAPSLVRCLSVKGKVQSLCAWWRAAWKRAPGLCCRIVTWPCPGCPRSRKFAR